MPNITSNVKLQVLRTGTPQLPLAKNRAYAGTDGLIILCFSQPFNGLQVDGFIGYDGPAFRLDRRLLEGSFMIRTPAIVLITASFASIAYGQQGQVVSYYVEPPPGVQVVVIPQVSAQGFVLTDLLVGVGSNLNPEVIVYERQNNVDTYKARLRVGGNAGPLSYNLASGIPFAPGSSLILSINGGGTYITVAGYTPSPTAEAPAVGGTGLVVMVVLAAIASAVVFRRGMRTTV